MGGAVVMLSISPVVLSNGPFGPVLELSGLSGTDGFVLYGVDAGDLTGRSVSGAGDINGDGVDDLIIGAPNISIRPSIGESYVVFGSSDMPIFPAGPDNDLFANAENLIGVNEALASGSTLTVDGTTVGATLQSGEPAHFRGGSGLPSGPRNSIWYRWTADADQIVEIDTAGSSVGTVLVAYTGAAVSELQEIATGIDLARDVARIRFAVRAGDTYHLAVDGYDNNSEGEIQLNIRQPTMDLAECTIMGTDGPDVLTGTTGPDVICALGGNDEIRGRGGSDIIFAGGGHDFVSSGGGRDIVFGEDGNDALFGERGGDRLFGGAGNDFLDGGPFNDLCVGDVDDDTLVNC
jgi:Ca2+-binding RTX toxin-like protein